MSHLYRIALAAAATGRPALLIRVLLEVEMYFIDHRGMKGVRSVPRLRPSVSHAASRRAEIDPIRRMTVEERVKAALGYVRFTEDLDLGVNTDRGTLRQAADALRTAGFEVELREPDGQDRLGGAVDVRGPFGLVRIVH